MTSSGYTPLPSDPPPAYAAGTFAGGYTDDQNKEASQAAVSSAVPAYPGMCVHYRCRDCTWTVTVGLNI